jgi:hypothetical protein
LPRGERRDLSTAEGHLHHGPIGPDSGCNLSAEVQPIDILRVDDDVGGRVHSDGERLRRPSTHRQLVHCPIGARAPQGGVVDVHVISREGVRLEEPGRDDGGSRTRIGLAAHVEDRVANVDDILRRVDAIGCDAGVDDSTVDVEDVRRRIGPIAHKHAVSARGTPEGGGQYEHESAMNSDGIAGGSVGHFQGECRDPASFVTRESGS